MGDKFKNGDLVFAKVRGYPPWPARVQDRIEDNTKVEKYCVSFFGTYETGVCRVEEMWHYKDKKEQFGKMQKRKMFKEALWEIENSPDVVLEKKPELPQLPKDDAADDDSHSEVGSTVSKNSDVAKVPRRLSVNKKRETIDSLEDETLVKKKPKRGDNTEIPTKASPSTPAAAEPERVSRSGRKIKPKRFLDEDDGQEEKREEHQTPVTHQARRTSSASHIPEEPKMVAAVAPIEAEDTPMHTEKISSTPKLGAKFGAKSKDSEDFVPPMATVSPIVSAAVSNVKLGQANKKMKVTFTQQQAKKMIDSDKTPERVRALLSKELQTKLRDKEESQKTRKSIKRKSKFAFLQIEVRLLQMDTIIKANLSLDKAETKPVLQALDDLKNLKLSPIMLKKHPDIVFTIKKLKKYIGNVKCWNFTEAEKEEFSKKAVEIRQKASQIFEYFKLVLLGSKDATDVSSKIMKQIGQLKEKTKDLSPTKFAALTKDPCAADGEAKSQKKSVSNETEAQEVPAAEKETEMETSKSETCDKKQTEEEVAMDVDEEQTKEQ